MIKSLPLHVKILLSIVMGLLVGWIFLYIPKGGMLVSDWITPFGDIFIRLLKMVAVPLIIVSLIKGIADLKDISKFSKMGIRTIFYYLLTTFIAIIIGLTIANLIGAGKKSNLDINPDDLKMVEEKLSNTPQDASPLAMLVEIIPENFFLAATQNTSMLQIIFFSVLFAISLISIPSYQTEVVKKFFDELNVIVLKIVDYIMQFSPIGVFALMIKLVVEAPSSEVFIELGKYAITVLIGLTLMLGVYATLLQIVLGKNVLHFFKGISPAQLVAFSTSSSAATLPVTMERVESSLGVNRKVSSFILPLGATINMDGTSLYQACATVFIANAYGISLDLTAQVTIVFTALLASIGTAAVPGAGLLMLVIVLESVGLPASGIALILAIDRPLDMCRTVINVTGDACITVLVAKNINELDDLKHSFDDKDLIA